jgi:3-oxoadipate enol-lactonase
MKATVNGLDTYYEIHGEENAEKQAKPWLVFSHSLACSTRMWDGQIAAFKDRFRVLAYDTRGHGQSAAPKGPYTLEGLADDLAALLRELRIQKAHFVGLSMGGMIGQTFALKYPGVFQSLTLADTTSRYPAEAAAMWQDRIKIAETKGMEPLVQPTLERWFTPAFRKSQPQALEKIATAIRSTPVAGYAGCCHAIPKIDVTSRLRELALPALVICGEQDPGTPPAMAREIAQNLPGAKLALIPQAAHLANVEQPEAFNRALGGFLSSLASARA